MKDSGESQTAIGSPESYINRELSWLSFARRVLALADSDRVPLLERVRFAGIVGMLHDEFFMKRMSGLKRQTRKGSTHLSADGKTPAQQLEACREEILDQMAILAAILGNKLRPQLAEAGVPIVDHSQLKKRQRSALRDYFRRSVQPILTPLAVDSEHPFPFISNLGLNLAVMLPRSKSESFRFVRIKVPRNRPRWVPLSDEKGFVPLEQVIAANLDLLFADTLPEEIYLFRVTRGADGERDADAERALGDDLASPGGIVRMVTSELKARRFAGVVRLQLEPATPKKLSKWLMSQLGVLKSELYTTDFPLGLRDLTSFEPQGRPELAYPPDEPITPPRLIPVGASPEPGAIFREIARGDILVHHPYESFDRSVLRFIESAAEDPHVLALKLTIYRTSAGSPIVQALADAARQGKQVAVLVEITARFDEAPNIAWGRYLENEGVHVSYGVERLKTHVKLALVVREEGDEVRRYVHVGTGNYHSGTAHLYEDVGLLTCDPEICEDAAAVFNSLTGAMSGGEYRKMLVAPANMRQRFVELIQREASHAVAGRPAGIDAKMNQLQDSELVEELYRASQAGVPIRLIVRGLCVLRPGVAGLSENISVTSVVGRYLEHSRIYGFSNAGEPEYFIGSADWMRRNLNKRVETVVPVADPAARERLAAILQAYRLDNTSAWDLGCDGRYSKRVPQAGEEPHAVQEILSGLPGEAPVAQLRRAK